MKNFKRTLYIGLATTLLSSMAYAKKSEEEHNHKKNVSEHTKKQQELPRGLQKKLQRDKQLPAGWQKKLVVGEPLDSLFLDQAMVVSNSKYYNKNIEQSPRETIYQIEDKLIKVMNATNIILDIFEIE